MTARAYYVHGIALVNTGGESCSACEKPAVGRSVSGHLICARHAGMAAVLAEEMAVEVEAAKARCADRHAQALEQVRKAVARIEANRDPRSESAKTTNANKRRAASYTHFVCGHERSVTNVYRRPDGRSACRECRRIRSTEAKRKMRERERARMCTRGKNITDRSKNICDVGLAT